MVNPFSVPAAPPWLSADPARQIPRLLERLLEVGAAFPELYTELPWLRGMNVVGLAQERVARKIFGPRAAGGQEETLTGFFARVTRPVAALIEALYTVPLLREERTVVEILRRMAQAVGTEPLPPAVVGAVCANFMPRRLDELGTEPIRLQEAVWQIHWHATGVRLRGPRGRQPAFVVLVTEQATEKVLAFDCLTEPPGAAALQLALYDALVFPGSGGLYLQWALAPPGELQVQGSLPPAVRQAAAIWGTTTRASAPQESAWLRECAHEIGPRILDAVQFRHILDRAGERRYGYAPFLAKRRVRQQRGWGCWATGDPLTRCLGLRELLPAVAAHVGVDGAVEWQGWHYRDPEHDVLRYFPREPVSLRPSPLSEALVAVDWQGTILCCAIADELRHADGSYRPYWFPYPLLGQ